jgi:hypothetical protein
MSIKFLSESWGYHQSKEIEKDSLRKQDFTCRQELSSDPMIHCTAAGKAVTIRA